MDVGRERPSAADGVSTTLTWPGGPVVARTTLTGGASARGSAMSSGAVRIVARSLHRTNAAASVARVDAGPAPVTVQAPLLSRAGVQVVFAWLADAGSLTCSLRALAARARVSLATAQRVTQQARREGYLVGSSRETALARGGKLLDLWVVAYRARLWDRQRLGRFLAPDRDWWRGAGPALREAGCQLGGDAAAIVLGAPLVSNSSLVYADALPAGLIAGQRWRHDPASGNVEIRQRIWRPGGIVGPGHGGLDVVPSVLVYADLLAGGDPRQAEIAQWLRRHDARLVDLDRT
ncbi:MAG: hypothetical protein LBM66_03875 [Bifidobacteriaceae bacterium]|jgi:hypothetical protein|nr:hypothetical protein [Bifidobacteriaceae bacterium]